MNIFQMMCSQPYANTNKLIKRRYQDSGTPYYTGTEVITDTVYSICPGTVISASRSANNTWNCSIQVNNNQVVRYLNLKECNVTNGDIVRVSTLMGTTYGTFKFEYCDSNVSNWPVRIETDVFYKHNPESLLSDVKLMVITDEAADTDEDSHISDTVVEYHTGNRGED